MEVSLFAFIFFFFPFVRWKLQSPRRRWQYIAGPPGFRTAYGVRECGLARFPLGVARRGGRTAADVLLSDCQHHTGALLCMADAEFRMQMMVEAVVACPKPEHCHLFASHRLVGLVVRRPPRERKIPGSNPACAGIFSGSSHTSDLNIGTPVATLPGAWRYRVSAGTGRPGVSIL